MTRRGVITVYLSLVTALMLSLILVSLESVRVAVIRTAAGRSADLAAEMVFSAYTRPAADRYGLFVLNAGDEQKRLSVFDEYLRLNLQETGGRLFALQAEAGACSAVSFTGLRDHGWQELTEQITRCQLYTFGEKGLSGAGSFLQGNSVGNAEDLQDSFARSLLERGYDADSAAAQEEKKEKGQEEKESEDTLPAMTDPRPGIGRLLKGRLTDVILEGRPVSGKSVNFSDCSYQTGADRPGKVVRNFMNYHSAAQSLKKQELPAFSGSIANAAAQDLILCAYILEYFRTFDGKQPAAEGEHVLDYEAEFILCGSGTDRTNLESALTRLFALRTACNLAYLYTSPGKGAALGEAVSMLAVTALPAVGSLIRLLLMLCWACAESLVDCAALTQGKKVPVMKSDATWNLSMAGLIQLATGEAGPGSMIRDGSSGLDYEQYLFLLLLMQNREKRLIRMTQIMEKNIRTADGYQDFAFKNCITGAVFSGEAAVKPRYFRHPLPVRIPYAAAYQY